MRVAPRSEYYRSQPTACLRYALHRERLLPLYISLCPVAAQAQLPLSIDALLMPASTFTVSVQSHWQQRRQPVLARRETRSGAALLSVGYSQVGQGVTAIGARYGLAPRMELNARLTHRQTRWRAPGAPAQRAEGYAADVGVSWLALPEQGAPAVLLDARADLVSRPALPGLASQWLDGVELGVTSYRSLDPVVLSVSGRYRYQRFPERAAFAAPAAHSVVLSPQVNFAVNANVTLVGGLSMQFRDVSEDSIVAAESRVATALRLGLGYAAGRRSTFFLNTHIATSGSDGGAGFDLEWLHRFP